MAACPRHVAAALLACALSCSQSVTAADKWDCEQLEKQIAKTESTLEYAKHNMRPGEAANAIYSANMKLKRYRKQYADANCGAPAPEQMQPVERPVNRDPKACMEQCRQYAQFSDQQCFTMCWSK